MGRDADLEWIKHTLNTSNRNRPRPAALLHGTGGVGKSEAAASAALATELGGLPLACEHAAAYVRQVGCGLAGYLRLLRQRFDKAAPVVFRTFTLAMEKAAEQAPLAETVMNLCACLAPEPIPRTLFSKEKGLGVLGGDCYRPRG